MDLGGGGSLFLPSCDEGQVDRLLIGRPSVVDLSSEGHFCYDSVGLPRREPAEELLGKCFTLDSRSQDVEGGLGLERLYPDEGAMPCGRIFEVDAKGTELLAYGLGGRRLDAHFEARVRPLRQVYWVARHFLPSSVEDTGVEGL